MVFLTPGTGGAANRPCQNDAGRTTTQQGFLSIPMIRFYLLISATLLSIVALGYGVAPGFVLPRVLGIPISATDPTSTQNLLPVFRAMMGLYLGMSSFWFVGVCRSHLARPAIISEVFFMSGLGLGRLLSVAVDGWPCPLLIIGMVLELLLALWGLVLLKSGNRSPRESP